MAERLNTSRARGRRFVRQGGPALKLSDFVPPPRDLVEQVYRPDGIFGDDDLGTIYYLPTDGSHHFEFVAGFVDIGPTRVEGLYFDIWIGGNFGGFEPAGLIWEAALLYSSDLDDTYDGWHSMSVGGSAGLFWGVDVHDRFVPPQMPFRSGPRPSGTVGLGLRGSYPPTGNTLSLREWRLTAVRLAP